MRFVPIKSADCQAAQTTLKIRDLQVRQRTQTINALRGHLGEFEIVLGRGMARVDDLIAIVREGDERLPPAARKSILFLADQIEELTVRIEALEHEVVANVRGAPNRPFLQSRNVCKYRPSQALRLQTRRSPAARGLFFVPIHLRPIRRASNRRPDWPLLHKFCRFWPSARARNPPL